MYSWKRSNPALRVCKAPLRPSRGSHRTCNQTVRLLLCQGAQCFCGFKGWAGHTHQGKPIQVYDAISGLGRPPDKTCWRLGGKLGTYHVVRVLCLPSSHSSCVWTLENGLGKPSLRLFLGLMFKGLILKPLQRLLWLWEVSEWGRQSWVSWTNL